MNTRFGTCERSDLVRRLRHALDVARNAITKLAPERYCDPQNPENSVEPEKVVAETALLLVSASSVQGEPQISTSVHSIAPLLIPHARSEKALVGLCFEPALALDHAIAHLCLTRLGYPDAGFDDLLQRSATGQWRNARERLPYRALEQEWLRRIGQRTPQKLSKHERYLLTASVLAGPLDLLSATRDDLYAFTHTLMYVTDLGMRTVRFPRPSRFITAEAEFALARCMDDQDYDVAGELLLTWPFLQVKWSAGALFAFSVLRRVEDQAGFLPTPATRIDRCNSLSGHERTRYLLATAYHTVYVMGLLCAAALRSGKLSESGARAPCIRGAAALLCQFIEQNSVGRHWMEDFCKLQAAEQDRLANFLFGVAAWRAAKKRDLPTLYKLLETSQRLGMAATPLQLQIAQLLQRVTALCQQRDAA